MGEDYDEDDEDEEVVINEDNLQNSSPWASPNQGHYFRIARKMQNACTMGKTGLLRAHKNKQ